MPTEYARALGRTPVWLFHGTEDNVVPPRESELMFEAFKAAGGHIRLWLYQGMKHDCWTRAYNEPELPRWLLAHRGEPPQTRQGARPELPALAERLIIPLHPLAIKLPTALLDSLAGQYCDARGQYRGHGLSPGRATLREEHARGVRELAAESPGRFFYPSGSSGTRLTFERDAQERVTALVLNDDRHEERWERRRSASSH